MTVSINLTERAAGIGREHGRSAANWVFDGNTSRETYCRVLKGIEDIDPEVMDAYRVPDLSGEWEGNYTDPDLARDLELDTDDLAYDEILADAASTYLDAASEAFWAEVERIARQHVPPDTFGRRRDAIAYLMADGNLRVPCSRYGRDTAECAPVAWRVAYLVAREQGEPVTREGLDHAMGLVVNDHDDVSYIVNAYGQGWYGRR
jgi:hypothetical protein